MSEYNLPNNLNLNEWLLQSLVSSNELDRQIALEEMITNGYDAKFEGLLKSIADKDPSKGCRIQAQWLLKLNESKSQLKGLIKKLDVTPEFIYFQLQKGDYAKVNLCSQLLRKSPTDKTLGLWRETLEKSEEPRLIETGLSILCKFGEHSDIKFALNHLSNPDNQVVCSALSLISQHDKAVLAENIGTGLRSRSINILLHSIHLLRNINERETLKYLAYLIMNKNALVRQKALRELTLIGFNKVEDLFWQYISNEDQPFLLIKAGFLASFNPAPNLPFKIYDIMSISSGVKKYILQLVLKKAIEANHAAGMLKGKDISVYMEEIKHYIANKRKEQVARVAIANLKAQDPKLRLSAIEILSQLISNQQIKALLEKQLKTEEDEEVKSYLVSLFEDSTDKEKEPKVSLVENHGSKSATAKEEPTSLAEEPLIENKETLNSFPNTHEFIKLSAKEQRKYINKIDCIEKYPISKKTLIDAVDYDIKKPVKLEILKKIGQYGNQEDAKQIYHMAKSQDHSIAAQAIKSIGTIDIDRILPELNKFLAHEDPRIKSSAFEVYIMTDKAAAVQYVGTMLKQASVSIKRIGLSLLPQLDYPSAEPMLWWMLTHETNIELQNQVGYMVAANPTKEGIIKLYEFTHDKNGEIKEGLSEMWEAGLTSAESIFETSAEEIEKNCWDNIVSSDDNESVETSNYKFNSVVGEENDIEKDLGSRQLTPESTSIEKLLIHFFTYKVQYIIGSVVMAIFIFLNTDKNPNTINRDNKTQVVSEVNFVTQEVSDLKTQVGSKDWKEGIKSGARNIIRSPGYAKVLETAAKEQEKFREEELKLEEAYFRKLANDNSTDRFDREWAAAKLNKNYNMGMTAFELGDYSKAESYLERAANDNSLSYYGRMDALQKLMEIYESNNDKGKWTKCLSRLLTELKKDPDSGFRNVDAFENFDQTIGNIENVSRQLKNNPEASKAFINEMKSRYKLDDSEAKKALEDLINFKHPFDGMHKH